MLARICQLGFISFLSFSLSFLTNIQFAPRSHLISGHCFTATSRGSLLFHCAPSRALEVDPLCLNPWREGAWP
ncbi:hypothetical protein BDV26DRAFT_144718 [Aspergillus bertholletiae]|uniref:Secreted protein n=1 Tax=Aspergillus bertholletiae TaxID=1226010 RepID=A0A5N7AMT7_9EURO|nr:hypothetical protein BDV26DRAFT_144718 [Aspergillus bertholletiae]